MTDLIVVPQTTDWRRLKALVLDSVCSPITRRVYNLGLDEFFDGTVRNPDPDSPRRRSAPGELRWRLGVWVRFRSTSGSRRSGSWRSKPPTTDCSRPNSPAGSRA